MKKTRTAEPADPGIKLFGRTIPSKMRAPAKDFSDDGQILSSEDLVHNNNVSEEYDSPSSQLDDLGSSSGSCEEDKMEPSKPPRKAAASNINMNNNNNRNDDKVVGESKKSQSPSPREAGAPAAAIHTKSQPPPPAKQGEPQQEKAGLKRPDKLVPCPRCNSMETKFCYFNNYNVNQPRHFCKNCQRYWTAGGTLRNVPVGAGRRKSKHNPGPGGAGTGAHHHDHQHQQHNKSEKLAASRMRLPPILPQEICHFGSPTETSPSGSVLTSLNSSSPASINSTILKMHLAAAAAAAAVASQAPGDTGTSPRSRRELAVPESSTETTTTNTTTTGTTTVDTGKKPETPVMKECNGCSGGGFGLGAWPCFAPQHPEANSEMVANWLSSVWAAGMPAWAPIAASLWGPSAAAAGAAGGWNVPWGAAAAAAAAALAAAASSANANCSPQFSKVLGKHPREKIECGRVDGYLWAPKTLRIDDPGEAAKSSIWQTLGLDKVPAGGAAAAAGSPSGVYKSLQSKGGLDDRGGLSQKVHANPAALSRSLSFQENSR